MRKMATLLVLGCGTASSFAAGLPCADLKAKIAAGLDAKNVTGYTLTVVPTSAGDEGKVVGTCDGGKNKILYVRGAAPAKPAPAPKPAPKAK